MQKRIKEIRALYVRNEEVVETKEAQNKLVRPQLKGMIQSRTVTISKIPEATTIITRQKSNLVSQKLVGSDFEGVNLNSKVIKPSFWSNSYAKSEASTS